MKVKIDEDADVRYLLNEDDEVEFIVFPTDDAARHARDTSNLNPILITNEKVRQGALRWQ